ncbi:MAG: hypothetical protein AB7Q27_26205 [Acidimicrobiia bacterium]
MAAAHVAFRDALTNAGWEIVSDTPSGTAHPYELIIRRGKVVRRLCVYAWNITHEGKGRSGNNWRVQTTRPDEEDLHTPDGFLAAGIGWKEDQSVLAAFDVWVKRTTGKSSSVHITRDLLDTTQADGWATEIRDDGPECAFHPDRVDEFLEWVTDRHQLFDGSAYPLQAPTITGDIAAFTIDRDDWLSMSLRVGSRIALRGKHGQLLNNTLWKVTKIETVRSKTANDRNTAIVRMEAKRYGTIHKDDGLLKEKA